MLDFNIHSFFNFSLLHKAKNKRTFFTKICKHFFSEIKHYFFLAGQDIKQTLFLLDKANNTSTTFYWTEQHRQTLREAAIFEQLNKEQKL
jgi:hypothetical protein